MGYGLFFCLLVYFCVLTIISLAANTVTGGEEFPSKYLMHSDFTPTRVLEYPWLQRSLEQAKQGDLFCIVRSIDPADCGFLPSFLLHLSLPSSFLCFFPVFNEPLLYVNVSYDTDLALTPALKELTVK